MRPRETALELLIVQPTPFCNIDCDYCYLPHRTHTATMSPAVFRRVIERVFDSDFLGDEFTVVWHAGEPLVVPPAWYESAIATVAELNHPGCRVAYNVQTNGTLINREWCRLFRSHPFRVGVSLDGPRFIHDLHRKRRSGKGTYDDVMRGIAMLRNEGIPFHTISVVTREMLDHADEVFAFFKDLNPTVVGFNIEEAEGVNSRSSVQGDASDALRRFTRRLFELWMENRGRPKIREFEGLMGSIGRWRPQGAHYGQETTPFKILNIDVHGNFSTFSPELLGQTTPAGPFVFGNVFAESFEEGRNSERFRTVSGEIARGIEQCRNTCEYFCLCGGGSPSNKYVENGTFDCAETRHCINTKKIMVDEVFEYLEARLGLAAIGDRTA